MQQEKPLGVDLLALVLVISGIFTVYSGIDALFFASFLASVAPVNTFVFGASAQYAAIWGSILIAVGAGSFLVAYGLFHGRSWGWSGAVALAIIGIVIPLMNVVAGYWPSVFTMVLSGIVLYFLFMPQVREYFGRPVSTPSSDAAAA